MVATIPLLQDEPSETTCGPPWKKCYLESSSVDLHFTLGRQNTTWCSGDAAKCSRRPPVAEVRILSKRSSSFTNCDIFSLQRPLPWDMSSRKILSGFQTSRPLIMRSTGLHKQLSIKLWRALCDSWAYCFHPWAVILYLCCSVQKSVHAQEVVQSHYVVQAHAAHRCHSVMKTSNFGGRNDVPVDDIVPLKADTHVTLPMWQCWSSFTMIFFLCNAPYPEIWASERFWVATRQKHTPTLDIKLKLHLCD